MSLCVCVCVHACVCACHCLCLFICVFLPGSSPCFLVLLLSSSSFFFCFLLLFVVFFFFSSSSSSSTSLHLIFICFLSLFYFLIFFSILNQAGLVVYSTRPAMCSCHHGSTTVPGITTTFLFNGYDLNALIIAHFPLGVNMGSDSIPWNRFG